ncbi:hypothetical protein [Lentibacillus sp. CBA3610]|nr:hypothetical protein [Lentibacillus sp. CBA3610]
MLIRLVFLLKPEMAEMIAAYRREIYEPKGVLPAEMAEMAEDVIF